jgi:hypothetical protein
MGQIYFFYLCNEDGFNPKFNGMDYDISIRDGCYYRDTAFFDLEEHNNAYACRLSVSDLDEHIINRNEAFSISNTQNDIERFFSLAIDYLENKTTFYHYTLDKNLAGPLTGDVSLFEKTFNNLIVRPDFSIENRDKLLSKFNNWLMLS